MSPAIVLNTSSDFAPIQAKTFGTSTHPRTLLLSPPSLSAHPERLDSVRVAHDRNATDIQMLDRLSLNLVTLPESTYDLIIILTDADDTRSESKTLLDSDLLLRIVKSLKPGGNLRSQDGTFATNDAAERREAIFAGLMIDGGNVAKPDHDALHSVPLRFGKAKDEGGAAAKTSAAGTGAVSLNLNGKRKNGPPGPAEPAGVGFVDFSDDLGEPEGEDDDDELIDEDTLLDEEDLKRPVVQRKANPRREPQAHTFYIY